VAGGWRRLHIEELQGEMGGHVSHMSEGRKPEGKRPLRSLGCRWENNIRMDIREIVWSSYGLDSSGSELGPLAGSCEHSNEHTGFIKSREFLLKKDSASWCL
jgi:hypothetical protein